MDHKREDRTPPLSRAMGVGRQQQRNSTIIQYMYSIQISTITRTKHYYISFYQQNTEGIEYTDAQNVKILFIIKFYQISRVVTDMN